MITADNGQTYLVQDIPMLAIEYDFEKYYHSFSRYTLYILSIFAQYPIDFDITQECSDGVLLCDFKNVKEYVLGYVLNEI